MSGPAQASASPWALPWISDRLRAPDGCPWDREQTHDSLRGHLLEETYEVYDALADMEKKSGGDPVAVLKRAVENVRPALEVRSRRVGGATYQVPVEVRPRRATTLTSSTPRRCGATSTVSARS